MKAIGFDGKSFERKKFIKKTEDEQEVLGGFYSPIGVGAAIDDFDLFKQAYDEKLKELLESFCIPAERKVYSSTTLKTELGLPKAIAFCDELISYLQKRIDLVHISYAILPPHEMPTVSVGGHMCPKLEIKTEQFLRSLQPYFSYIAAWDFLKKRPSKDFSIQLDGFKSKSSLAWDELIHHNRPLIYSRGDECNPLISTADIIAFLTDAKLYNQKLPLTLENIETIWAPYDFNTNCHYIDRSQISKIKWYTNNLIDIKPYLAKPTIFLMIDEIEKIGFKKDEIGKNQTTVGVAYPLKPKKFKKIIQRLPPYINAVNKAYELGGCVQFFDRFEDSDKIQDGDILAYMGEINKKIAQTYEDGFDVTVLKLKELGNLKGKK